MAKIKELEKQERKILRKIHGAVFRENVWQKRPTEELYRRSETITTHIRKRRASFFAHIARMNNTRLTKRIFNIISTSKMGTSWYKETTEDLQKLNITIDDIHDRKTCRDKIKNQKIEFRTQPQRSRRKWTDEQKKVQSERMKAFWEEKKKKQKKKNTKC